MKGGFMHAHSIKSSKNNEEKKIVLRKALLRMAENLELSRRELCAILGLSEASLSRLYDEKRFINPQSKEGELAAMLLRLYRSLDALFGGNQAQCRLWLRSENRHLSNTPILLIQSIEGLITTITYLDAMRGRN
jgi:hypothetical protein